MTEVSFTSSCKFEMQAQKQILDDSKVIEEEDEISSFQHLSSSRSSLPLKKNMLDIKIKNMLTLHQTRQ